MCAACGIDYAALLRDPDLPLGPNAARLEAYAARRLAREPISRILGKREFWGLPFEITTAVLDPRSDTESLIRAVLSLLGDRSGAALTVLDLGTGSAAILCAILSELPAAQGFGVDRSFDACVVAARNVAKLGFGQRAHIVCGSWCEALKIRFDIVLSNPPYVKRDDIAALMDDVRLYDPLIALDGGRTGLAAYTDIIPRLRSILKPGGIAAFECGWDQSDSVAALLTAGGLQCIKSFDDLGGHQRGVVATRL